MCTLAVGASSFACIVNLPSVNKLTDEGSDQQSTGVSL